MVFYTQQGPQASDSPLCLSPFFILLEEETAAEGLLFLLSEDKWKRLFVCFSHSIFMTTYLVVFLSFLCADVMFLLGYEEVDLLKLSHEVGGGALEFALVKNLEELSRLMCSTCERLLSSCL